MRLLIFNCIVTVLLLVASDRGSIARSIDKPTVYDGEKFESNPSFKEMQQTYLTNLKENIGGLAKYELKYGSMVHGQFLIDSTIQLDDIDMYLEQRQSFISYVEEYCRLLKNLDGEATLPSGKQQIAGYKNLTGIYLLPNYKLQDDLALYELENIITHVENATTRFASLQPLVDRLKEMKNTVVTVTGTAIDKNNSVDEMTMKINDTVREIQTKPGLEETNVVKGKNTENEELVEKLVTLRDIDLDRTVAEDALSQKPLDRHSLSEETARTLQMARMSKKLIDVIDLSIVKGQMNTFREDKWGPPRKLRYLTLAHNFIRQLFILLDEDAMKFRGTTTTRFHRNKRNATFEELDNIPSVETSQDRLVFQNETNSTTDTTSEDSPAIAKLDSSDHITSNSTAQQPFLKNLNRIEVMYSACATVEDFKETSRIVKKNFANVDFESNYWTENCLNIKAETTQLNNSNIAIGRYICWDDGDESLTPAYYVFAAACSLGLISFIVGCYVNLYRLNSTGYRPGHQCYYSRGNGQTSYGYCPRHPGYATRNDDYVSRLECAASENVFAARDISYAARHNGNAARVNGNAARHNGNAARVNGNAARVNGNAARVNGNAARHNGNAARHNGNAARVYGNAARPNGHLTMNRMYLRMEEGELP